MAFWDKLELVPTIGAVILRIIDCDLIPSVRWPPASGGGDPSDRKPTELIYC